jgi:LysR family glycine cleavage system transcriptional activator
MPRRLPPLNALRAFEAAARHTSFARAAEELHVTPGAVSQQVKALEAWLGVELFRRLHRGLALSQPGRDYLGTVGPLLDQLALATEELCQRKAAEVLRIAALPAFAEKWLVPRLGRFRARHPEIEVQVSASDHLLEPARDPVDVGLWYSDGKHPGLTAELLLEEEIFPACSPAFLEGTPALKRPEDLGQHVLLHDVGWRADWLRWLAAAGVEGVDPLRGSSFTLYSMAVQAAIDGLGVVMAHGALVAGDLAAGRLAEPFELRLPAPRAYYMVTAAKAADRPALGAFRDWLLAEAGR